MTNGWSGADPVGFTETGTSYELGTVYTANGDLTIQQVRVWSDSGGAARANRAGKVWSLAGASLGTVALPDTLTPGWTAHTLATPIEITSGTQFVVSYDVTTTYGANTTPGYPRNSSDNLVTATGGRLSNSPDDFPATPVAGSFYGIDVVFVAGLSGNERPVVTISATVDTLQATATIGITDEDPDTVTYAIEWGDGQTTSTASTGPHAHTYAAAGLYAIMVTATDSAGLTDSAAIAVAVPDAFTAPESGVDVDGLLDVLASHARRIGHLDAVSIGEPKRLPAEGFSMGIWLDDLSPALSGSGSMSLRAIWLARVYGPTNTEPSDLIDPRMTHAALMFMGAIVGDFQLGGHPQVRAVDLKGSHGIALASRAGYLEQNARLYRVMTVTVPVLINDVWDEEA